MKISYINLKDKLKEYKNKNKEENIKEDIEKDTKFIGINYNKKNKSKKMKIVDNFKKAPRGSYTLIIFMIFLLVVTTRVNIDTYSKLSQENYDTYVLNQDEDIEVSNSNVILYQEAASSVFDENIYYEEAIQTTSSNSVQTNKDILEDEIYVYEYSYIRPVEGETIKEYSMDKVIYSKTLDMWKVHDGIDIYANIGTDVKACEKGIVERVYEDAFYGYSVIIDHNNGIKTIYRNLAIDVLVKEKDEVQKGTVIGKVGNTANSEIKDESHIHFEVVQNSQIVNPNIIGIK